MTHNEVDSHAIGLLRFPLIVGVVTLHAVFDLPEGLKAFDFAEHLVKELGHVAVPLFFLFSGYLFFKGLEKRFSWAVFRGKLHRRVRSLLVPYVLWNALFLLFLLALQLLFPGLLRSHSPILSYGVGDWLNSFWNYNGQLYGYPVLYAFWFLRNLMVLNVLSPLLWLVLKHGGRLAMGFVCGFFAVGSLFFVQQGIDWTLSVCFYMLGAWLRMSGLTVVRNVGYGHLLWVSALAMLVFFMAFRQPVFHNFYLLAAVLALPQTVGRVVERRGWQPNRWMAPATFFVFAAHVFIMPFFNRAWTIWLPATDVTAIAMLLVVPAMTVAFCLVGFYALCRYTPWVIKVLVNRA